MPLDRTPATKLNWAEPLAPDPARRKDTPSHIRLAVVRISPQTLCSVRPRCPFPSASLWLDWPCPRMPSSKCKPKSRIVKRTFCQQGGHRSSPKQAGARFRVSYEGRVCDRKPRPRPTSRPGNRSKKRSCRPVASRASVGGTTPVRRRRFTARPAPLRRQTWKSEKPTAKNGAAERLTPPGVQNASGAGSSVRGQLVRLRPARCGCDGCGPNITHVSLRSSL